MTYGEALGFLASLESLGIRPGLDRIRALLARLGDPQRAFPSVLIAGTNGKGSVAAFLASILNTAGVRAGLYTSPHLISFEERIAVAGAPIAPVEVAALTSEVASAVEAERRSGGEPPTYFEATTALAFLHFARRRIPFAVLEVGMGGRFDATNVVEPTGCALTPVAHDHMLWLGDTLPEIAFQKAGILRPGVPAAVARQDPAALAVIRAEACRLRAPLLEASACEARPPSGARGYSDPPVFSLETPSGGRYERLGIRLRGDHQVENATLAVLLSEILAEGPAPSLDPSAIARGLERAAWPGRIEIVPGRPDLLLDGAHNPAGCKTLAAYLEGHQAGRRIALIFAAMKDKPAEAMLRILCPLARQIVVTSLPAPRGERPERLHALAAGRGPEAALEPEVAAALEAARRAAGEDGLVVAAGSLYLVGEIKKVIGGR